MSKKFQNMVAVKKGFGSKGNRLFSALLAGTILFLSFNTDAYALDWDKRVALVNAAQAELDAGEKDYEGAGNNKYGYWYADKMGSDTFSQWSWDKWRFVETPYSSVPWCTIFVSYCAEQADIGTGDIPLEMSAPRMYQWYVDNDKFRAKGTYAPEPGDLVFFEKDDGICHVGIVKAVTILSLPAVNYTGYDVTVIDGNNCEAVAETTYYGERTETDMWIKGYGRN